MSTWNKHLGQRCMDGQTKSSLYLRRLPRRLQRKLLGTRKVLEREDARVLARQALARAPRARPEALEAAVLLEALL